MHLTGFHLHHSLGQQVLQGDFNLVNRTHHQVVIQMGQQGTSLMAQAVQLPEEEEEEEEAVLLQVRQPGRQVIKIPMDQQPPSFSGRAM